MEENILDEEWKESKRNWINIALLSLIILNPFMYFVIMPMEQAQANSHTESFISLWVFFTMIILLIIGISNLSKYKSKSIFCFALSFNLIFWLFILSQIDCTQCSQA